MLLSTVALGATTAAAEVPKSLTHQGRLLNDDGEPKTGEAVLQFTIYDAKSGGALVWESKSKSVDLGDSGFYSVTLGGEQNPIDAETLAGDSPLWISMTVDGGEELSPRVRLRSVPYAVRAGTAASAESVPWANVSEKPDGLDDTLGTLSCSPDQMPAWDGSSWVCEDPGQTYDGSDFAVSDQACGDNEMVVGINDQGQIQCGTDSDTTYSAGAGLQLDSNNEFRLVAQSCSGNQVAIGFNSNGSVICTEDTDTNTVYSKDCSSGKVVGGLESDGSVVCVNDSDTTYSAGAGIDESGNTFSLSGQSCSTGDLVTGVQNGTFQCTSAVNDLQAGQGIIVSGSNGSVTVSADDTSLQTRISDSCPDGQTMVSVNQDGTVNCKVPGDEANPSEVAGDCQGGARFIPATVCPVGDNDGPDCSNAEVGEFCEDTGCSGLDTSLDNCGVWDWYMRTE
jgi:hypothetical protein